MSGISFLFFLFFLSFFFFLLNPMNNWFCNRDNSTVLFVAHYLTSCNIEWCGGFEANSVVIIQITVLFILKFHLNLKGANVQGLSISYCSKSVAAERKCQLYLYYHKFTDFCSVNNWNLWFIGLSPLLQHR